MKNKQTILFLAPYPVNEAPSQRFRFEQYLSLLFVHGYTYRLQSFLSSKTWTTIYAKGKIMAKAVALAAGFLKRLAVLFLLPTTDYVFIHREASPIGPPVFEWFLAKICRKKIIYDFDDAIWLTDKAKESKVERAIRWRRKVASICRWSYRVSCGNEYLADYARQFNSNVVVNPTTIDIEGLHNPKETNKESSDKITIGWTGSHSTLKYLKKIEPVLLYLESRYAHIKVLVIADRMPNLSVRNLVFIPWNKKTEAEDLAKIDIGIMPLPDDEWSKGKCGFKALQYMAMEIPCVISPVGVNTQLIEPGVNGFFAASEQQWIMHLEYLINNKSTREQLGKAGRKKVVENYSVRSNASNFLSLFE